MPGQLACASAIYVHTNSYRYPAFDFGEEIFDNFFYSRGDCPYRQFISWVSGPKAASKPHIHQTHVEKSCV